MAYEVSFGYWKQHDFFKPYLKAHPTAQDPKSLWNSNLPGGLQAFWGKVRGIRQQKRTMEAENVNEADVTAWVEQQVLSLSGLTAEDRDTWCQPATEGAASRTSCTRRSPGKEREKKARGRQAREA